MKWLFPPVSHQRFSFMKNNKAVCLSIVYLIAFVVFDIYSYCLFEHVAPSDDQQFLLMRLAVMLFMPIVMTAVLAFFMGREGRFSRLLLFYTFVTAGTGAIFYPLWLKKQRAPHFAQLKKFVLIYSVALVVSFVWPLVSGTHAWGAFLSRNDWAAYLPYLYNAVMAYLAIAQLREMNCRHLPTWICAIVLMLCSSSRGVFMVVLLYTLYGNDFKSPNSLTKYWVVAAAQALLFFVWMQVYNMLLMRNNHALMSMSWVDSVIFDVALVLLVIFFIKDYRSVPVKGRAWLILPVVVTFIIPLVSLETVKQTEE